MLKRRRDKPKKKHFTLSDFDISQMPKPAEKAEVENTLSQSVASDDSRDASQLVIDEKMKKRREMLEKKMLRKRCMAIYCGEGIEMASNADEAGRQQCGVGEQQPVAGEYLLCGTFL